MAPMSPSPLGIGVLLLRPPPSAQMRLHMGLETPAPGFLHLAGLTGALAPPACRRAQPPGSQCTQSRVLDEKTRGDLCAPEAGTLLPSLSWASRSCPQGQGWAAPGPHPTRQNRPTPGGGISLLPDLFLVPSNVAWAVAKTSGEPRL